MNDPQRFSLALAKVLSTDHQREGIGTQGEKILHSAYKLYYEPDTSFHEIKTGRYIADIRNGEKITEIQTSGLYRMKSKLTAFLPNYKVTVVHPIPHRRTVTWIENDGTLSERRKSPKIGKLADAVSELYGIRDFLTHPNLTVVLSFVDVSDYKVKNGKVGRKRGTMRYERVPTELFSEVSLSTPSDYRVFLPEGLPDVFTSADVCKLGKLGRADADYILLLLTKVGTLERVGRNEKKFYLYRLA